MWPFYVYELVDPRTGAVFYVGKGKGRRIEAHEAEARRGEASDKCDRIRAIWAAGCKVVKREVARFRDEADALEHEAACIASYSGLTNVVQHDATRARTRPFWLEPAVMRVVAWWLKATKGGAVKPRVEYVDRPWATAVANATIRRELGRDLFEKALGCSSFEEVAKRLRPFGVELVR